jgi:hypothetical protein
LLIDPCVMSVAQGRLFRNQLTQAPPSGGTFILQGRGFLARGLFLAEAIQPHDFGALARLCRLVLVLSGGW